MIGHNAVTDRAGRGDFVAVARPDRDGSAVIGYGVSSKSCK